MFVYAKGYITQEGRVKFEFAGVNDEDAANYGGADVCRVFGINDESKTYGIVPTVHADLLSIDMMYFKNCSSWKAARIMGSGKNSAVGLFSGSAAKKLCYMVAMIDKIDELKELALKNDAFITNANLLPEFTPLCAGLAIYHCLSEIGLIDSFKDCCDSKFDSAVNGDSIKAMAYKIVNPSRYLQNMLDMIISSGWANEIMPQI